MTFHITVSHQIQTVNSREWG